MSKDQDDFRMGESACAQALGRACFPIAIEIREILVAVWCCSAQSGVAPVENGIEKTVGEKAAAVQKRFRVLVEEVEHAFPVLFRAGISLVQDCDTRRVVRQLLAGLVDFGFQCVKARAST